MADNFSTNAASGGADFASDDIGGVQYPRVKATWGPDGTSNDTDDASGKRLPVKEENSAAIAVSVASLDTKLGQVQASPTANTLLDRLKALLTGIVLAAGSNKIGKVVIRNSADGADIDPLSETDFDAKTGSLTETAPATDTASSGVNGRLQRIAQRITSLITALGSPLQAGGDVNVTDRAARDCGKIDIAAFDVALPAGANAIGKLAANSGVDIGDVDVTSLPALVAGAALIGKVGIDQTTPGTTDSVSVATAQGAGATIGTTSGAAVVTDANGTLQQYLRGIVKLLITSGTIVLGAGSAAIGKLAANAGVYIGDVGHGKTIKTASGTLTSDTDVIAAVSSKRIKVIAYMLRITDNTADTIIAKSNGTGGTELFRWYLRGPDANTPDGANLSIPAPSFLFATAAGEKLTFDVNSGATLHYSITYFDDDAT